ncbi:hypothetical protein B0H14DRAFT_2619555 [Mycena olivaceomarginata]|nr:hypothetical protein B0H14DRAFT_2619555 [Mycena olivaceomarginata]
MWGEPEDPTATAKTFGASKKSPHARPIHAIALYVEPEYFQVCDQMVDPQLQTGPYHGSKSNVPKAVPSVKKRWDTKVSQTADWNHTIPFKPSQKELETGEDQGVKRIAIYRRCLLHS